MCGPRTITWWGAWAILNEVNDRMKISELKNKVPLYGSAFDYTITALQMAGLIRIVREGNEEYVELTELGKNIKSMRYPPPWGFPGWFGWAWRGWHRHWWDW
ncbi:hypothetical protein [Vulcanisaeta thermophila]|uniref:hypothetical protein n=1 Tax=Vulcanisaeta thermophila TaxID=867917 RepID=UPI0008535AE4|nr:hypothetical protein [Vulcanisaeta thermophila]